MWRVVGGSACIQRVPLVQLSPHAEIGQDVCFVISPRKNPVRSSRSCSPACCSRWRHSLQLWRFITSWRQRTTTGMNTPIPTCASGCNITRAIPSPATRRPLVRSSPMGRRIPCRPLSLSLSRFLHPAPLAHLLNDNSAPPSVDPWSSCVKQPGLCPWFRAGGEYS